MTPSASPRWWPSRSSAGFGVTLGNALRRVLLSSLQGAAVQSVHIDGVLHEFSSIPGVREDVTDIVLNIKDIAIKMQGEGPKRMVVKKSGPSTITAGDIQVVGDIVILNPDHVICHLDEGAEIRMEFTVATGKGYVPAERNRPEDAPIGLIRSTACSRRCAASPIASRIPARARSSTTTS
jgi:DNA-directed RNA polymerase subunit alpha